MKYKGKEKEYSHNYYIKHRKHYLTLSKLWQQEHRTYRKRYCRDYFLRTKYGITLKEYEGLLKNQRNKCLICGNREHSRSKGKIKKLSVDHNHVTGKIRGLLCDGCNRSLGWAEKNKIKLFKYLEER